MLTSTSIYQLIVSFLELTGRNIVNMLMNVKLECAYADHMNAGVMHVVI
jgi:hypothetical protein